MRALAAFLMATWLVWLIAAAHFAQLYTAELQTRHRAEAQNLSLKLDAERLTRQRNAALQLAKQFQRGQCGT